jgi:hypothetical protein
MKQFFLGFGVCMIIWLAVLSMIKIPEYTIVKEVTCV